MKTKDAQMSYDLTFTEDELVVIRDALMHCTALPKAQQRKIFSGQDRMDLALDLDSNIYDTLFGYSNEQ